MGYYITQTGSDVRIDQQKLAAAYAACMKMDPEKDGGGGTYWTDQETGERRELKHFSWVDTAELRAATDLEDVLKAWGMEYEVEHDGAITGIAITDWHTKAGDEDQLFSALAPFIDAGGTMSFVGEENEAWGLHFDGSRVDVVEGAPLFSVEAEIGRIMARRIQEIAGRRLDEGEQQILLSWIATSDVIGAALLGGVNQLTRGVVA